MKRICFINGSHPNFLGGMSLYQRNLIKNLNKKIKITLVYFGKENKRYEKESINYVEIKSRLHYPLDQIVDNLKILKYLKNNNFDIINSHALWGQWMKFYKKKNSEKLVHTYHGVTYNFFKNHLRRFNFSKKIFFSPMLLFSYLIEKPPMKKADEIICVSEKVKNQLQELYVSRRKMNVIRTGVDLKDFKPRNKESLYKKLNLDSNLIYGLYVGAGGYWTKGLDRAISLGKEINKIDKRFRLVLIGPDYEKVKHLIKKDFIVFLQNIPREKMSLYYSVSDVFFCMSRYEGGAPTLVVSEAMASGCLLICSEDSEQEIIKSNENGLIIKEFGKEDAREILKTLKNKGKIIKSSLETIKKFSLEKWRKRTMEVLLK